MGFTSIWHWLIVLAVVLILFARPGKISGIMGDFGKGLRSFKDGMKPEDAGDENNDAEEAEVIEAAPTVKSKAPAKKAAKKTTQKKAAKKKAAKKKAAKKKAAKAK